MDADYRGEVGVVLINLGEDPVAITRGMRVAQIIFEKYDSLGGVRGLHMVHEREEDTSVGTVRGTGGFGSTGV